MSGRALLIVLLGFSINFVLSNLAGTGAAKVAAARARADKMIEMECMMVSESMLLVDYVNAFPLKISTPLLTLKKSF